MRVNEFISTLQNEFKCGDDSLISGWIELNTGSNDVAETDLDDTVRALYFVKNNFNEKTLKKTLAYPTAANKIIDCAVLFHAGRPIEFVDNYVKSGAIESGYIPGSYDEKGTLSIVHFTGPNDCVFICRNIPEDELKNTVEQAMNNAREIGSAAEKEFENYALADNRIKCYGQDVIGIFMMNIYSLDKDCSAFGYRVTCHTNLGIVTVDEHPTLAALESETIGDGITDDVNEEPEETFNMQMM